MKNFELIFWIAALIALGFSDPTQAHYSLCPLKLMGFGWCPGCGIGHAISYLLRGNIIASFHAHWLGVPALGVLLYRIYTLGFARDGFSGDLTTKGAKVFTKNTKSTLNIKE